MPEPQGTPTLGDDGLLVREGADGALDPGDEYGLEAALQLVEAAGEGEITLISMGPEIAHAAVQRGLAMGAHKGIRITDDALRGADALVTARVLANAIERGPFDLVVGGVESTDGYTG
ncbi:MAG TPA: electron transfer flavoprotein subunit beta, partial [Actinomycetota bacterium]|nr:electron transfer flavoprotein subunit beta [Actinomycetota bacterium]